MIIKINGSVNINNTKIKMDNLSIEINGAVNINRKEGEEKNLPREVNKTNKVDNSHVTNAVTEASINNKSINYNHIADMVMEGSTKEDLQNIIVGLIKKVAGEMDMDTIISAARKISELMTSLKKSSDKNSMKEIIANVKALISIIEGELIK